MLTYIQKKYKFTDYQTAQLRYTFTIIFSEVSKFIILLLIFHGQPAAFLYSFILLGILRLSVGGMHAKTYWGCFFASLTFFYAALILLPQFRVTKTALFLLLVGCMLITCKTGAVSSPLRREPGPDKKKRLVQQSLFTIFMHLILIVLFDDKLFTAGSWIVILQTIQLVISKYYYVRRR